MLSDEEIAAFWQASGEIGYPFGSLYRLLLLTGLRKRELSDMVRGELDMKEQVIAIPRERMKGKVAHVTPLSKTAVSILEGFPVHSDGDFLFTTMAGRVPISGFSKAKVALDQKMLAILKQRAADRGENSEAVVLVPFVIHDLRRTTRTLLARLGVSEHIAEAVLAHQQKGVAGIYNRFSYLAEKREALERLAGLIRDLTEPVPANVFQLGGGAERKRIRSKIVLNESKS